jgi:hypothetical protein
MRRLARPLVEVRRHSEPANAWRLLKAVVALDAEVVDLGLAEDLQEKVPADSQRRIEKVRRRP